MTIPPVSSTCDIKPYITLPLVAGVAIIPVFSDMIAKSALQQGKPIPKMTTLAILKEGIKAAPTIGMIVGTQMIFQSLLEKKLLGGETEANLSSSFFSSSIVGVASSPILAIFNGKTMGWSLKKSLQKFSLAQGVAITLQETAFVGSLSVSNHLGKWMQEKFGEREIVDYTAAFIAGVGGSLAGHPFNTMLTRWQSGLKIESPSQLFWGSLRKARGVGLFAVFYKWGKENLG